MADTVVVAGITGALGREVGRALRARGVRVRGLARDVARIAEGTSDEARAGDAMDPASLAGAFAGATAVFSCVGASVMPELGHGWRSFTHLDMSAHRALADAAAADGVRRFVYVSVAHVAAQRGVAYIDAHEQAAAAIAARGLETCVVRPTGFFSALGAYVDMAAAGRPLPVFGDGSARSNPIDDRDLAAACAEAVLGRDAEMDVGGPEVLTRLQMCEKAFEALGRPPRLMRVPVGALDAVGAVTRLFHPRIGQALRFYASLARHDVVVPSAGTRTLGEHFRERAAALGLPRPTVASKSGRP